MLLLRELGFRIRFPIPLLADNVADILIAKSPTHTKYARHISLRTHYIRTILPFRDFIIAFIRTMWNFADLNTKAAAAVVVFQRLVPFILNGLHTFNWNKEVIGTLNDIWQQTEARENAKDLKRHITDFDNTRKRQRSEEKAKEAQSNEKDTTNSGGVKSVTFKRTLNGHDSEIVDGSKRRKDSNS